MSWICFLCCFQSREGSSGSGMHHPLPAVPGNKWQLRGGCGVIKRHWGASWGHLYPLQVTYVLQSPPDLLGSVFSPFGCCFPTLVPHAKLSSGCHLLSAPLPEIHLQLFYFTMPNPWSEKGISCLYMELQTCIKPPKMFLSKNLNSCQLS